AVNKGNDLKEEYVAKKKHKELSEMKLEQFEKFIENLTEAYTINGKKAMHLDETIKILRENMLVIIRIIFDDGYEQYKDSTGKKLYSYADHLDENRKRLYRKRHAGEGNSNRKYSAGWFSWHYLW
ncbi:MAG: hypothetical protein HWN80_20720, partial [Candidatus Lokiarchaeota archaeon]|nr:hypothetical protein [Candidatus Lokiarchaeota archaeon]